MILLYSVKIEFCKIIFLKLKRLKDCLIFCNELIFVVIKIFVFLK